ncbi:MAG: signal peptidase I [Clostridia bacterium]|nr:signal peptidase I [Clostridia bacterium]
MAKNKTEKEKTKRSWDVFDFAELFFICAAFVILVFSLCVRVTTVDGSSMENTLQDKDYLLVQVAFYEPERGDIVVINDFSKDDISTVYAKPLVKRIIAVEGDTVEIRGGVLYLNGSVSSEDYIKETMWPSDMPLTKIDEGNIFVMGDNRNHSGDSRIFGQVDERCIVGKAFARVFPFDSISFLSNPNK